jgi:hypothetical protein
MVNTVSIVLKDKIAGVFDKVVMHTPMEMANEAVRGDHVPTVPKGASRAGIGRSAALATATEKVKNGDLAGLETTLTAQAVALNAMFTQLAHRTSTMTNVDQIDRFTRLALKAQGQCRATIETLALMKNPPTVFARQANIAHGPQQVNNGTSSANPGAQPSRAGNQESEPIKLLEAPGECMDFGTTSTAGRGDQTMAPVGTVNRPTNR